MKNRIPSEASLLFLALIVFLAPNLYAQTLPAYLPSNGLVAWYPFNGNANDESGNGNDGTVNGAILGSDRDGNSLSSYSFDGINDFIQVAHNNNLNPFPLSIGCWLKSSSASTGGIVSKYPYPYADNGWSLHSNQGKLSGYFYNYYGGSVMNADFSIEQNGLVSDGNWHFIFVVYSSSNASFYLDSELINSVSYTGNGVPSSSTSNTDLFFGRISENFSTAAYFFGQIDDIAIYNRVLTQEEITALYTGTPVNNNAGNNTANAVPPGIPYQAVVRNANGQVAANSAATTKFTLHQNTTDGTVEYQETYALITNAQGLISAVIGQGTAVQGTFAEINWSNTTKFLQVEVDLGNGFVDLGTQQLMSVPFAMYAANGPVGPQGPAGADGATGPQGPQGPAGSGGFVHWIGESFGGGVVFHVYKDALGEEHGLIVSLTDLTEVNTGVTWGLNGTDILDCESFWNGSSNTSAIIGAGPEPECAAQLCINYSGGGFVDWYLPALDELDLINQVQYNLNRTFSSIPTATSFDVNPGSYYWSSSEVSEGTAWAFSFRDGDKNDFNAKTNGLYVRAVRSF